MVSAKLVNTYEELRYHRRSWSIVIHHLLDRDPLLCCESTKTW